MTPVFAHGRLRLYLLKLLDESPRHGYDVIRELEDRFMGLYSPSAGTVYPRLARLEAEGLVAHEVQEGRKVYRITDAGRQELAERQGDLDDLEQEIAGSVRDLATEIRSEVRGSVKDLQAELKAAGRTGRRPATSARPRVPAATRYAPTSSAPSSGSGPRSVACPGRAAAPPRTSPPCATCCSAPWTRPAASWNATRPAGERVGRGGGRRPAAPGRHRAAGGRPAGSSRLGCWVSSSQPATPSPNSARPAGVASSSARR